MLLRDIDIAHMDRGDLEALLRSKLEDVADIVGEFEDRGEPLEIKHKKIKHGFKDNMDVVQNVFSYTHTTK